MKRYNLVDKEGHLIAIGERIGMDMQGIIKKIYNIIPFKKYIFLLLKKFHLPHSIYKHLHFKGIIKIPVKNKHFYMRHYGYQIENNLFWAGIDGWEKDVMKIWIELCQRSNVILDIGANTGVYALIGKTINPNSKVYAFECVHRVIKKLRRNCRLNNFNITCCEVGCSNADGTAIIHDLPTEHIYSVTLNENRNKAVNTIPTKIKTRKLSSFIKEEKLEKIDLIKIDTDGHEKEVLLGMEEYLDAMKPYIIMEILKEADPIKNILPNYRFNKIDEYNYLLAPKA